MRLKKSDDSLSLCELGVPLRVGLLLQVLTSLCCVAGFSFDPSRERIDLLTISKITKNDYSDEKLFIAPLKYVGPQESKVQPTSGTFLLKDAIRQLQRALISE